MKRFICVLLTMVMSLGSFSVSAATSSDIDVCLNGQYLEFDVQPTVMSNRVMVPMRKIFESLGASVTWDNNTKKITAIRNGANIVMQLDNNVMYVNNNPITLDVPPTAINGRTLVPVRAIAEAFDSRVLWDAEDETVVISKPIQFKSNSEAFDYLRDWTLEYGTAFADYIYFGWDFDDYTDIMVHYYPESDGLAFKYSHWDGDNLYSSMVFLYTNPDGTIRGSYHGGYGSKTNRSKIGGFIDLSKHSPNYPLSYEKDEKYLNLGEFGSELSLVEFARGEVNYMLEQIDLLLAYFDTGVTLNSLGFRNY